jgi:hypothetical protein
MNIYKKLPDDIKEIILNKYLIYPQKKELLDDIANFTKMKNGIYNIYQLIGYEYTDDFTDDINIDAAIDNDLMAYWNNDIAYYQGISNDNVNKMQRIFAYNVKSNLNADLAKYNFHLSIKTSPKTKINRYLAGLNTNERRDFVKKIAKI